MYSIKKTSYQSTFLRGTNQPVVFRVDPVTATASKGTVVAGAGTGAASNYSFRHNHKNV
ncbi:MAG: DUF4374 domain-containing protein [Tannerella sp.]|jgi:hypothetical protein|nr:DUF4374 domain-containing protein [Tannerella sp.]